MIRKGACSCFAAEQSNSLANCATEDVCESCAFWCVVASDHRLGAMEISTTEGETLSFSDFSSLSMSSRMDTWSHWCRACLLLGYFC